MKYPAITVAIAAASLALGLSSAVSAKPLRHHGSAVSQMPSSLQTPYNQMPATDAQGPDPYGAYVGGRLIGRDPDPNVREELKNSFGRSAS